MVCQENFLINFVVSSKNRDFLYALSNRKYVFQGSSKTFIFSLNCECLSSVCDVKNLDFKGVRMYSIQLFVSYVLQECDMLI